MNQTRRGRWFLWPRSLGVWFSLGVWLALGACLVSPAQARLPADNPVPGGVAVVRLKGITALLAAVPGTLPGPLAKPVAKKLPVVQFGGRPTLVVTKYGNWYAVVGLASSMAPGDYILRVSAEQVDTTESFRVMPLPTTTRRITRLPDDLGKLAFAATLPRSPRKLSQELWGYAAQPDFVFAAVVDSIQQIPYGVLLSDHLRRRYADHPSVTYFARSDARVHSPAAGVVHRIQRAVAGTDRIYINHGRGVTSVFSHVVKTTLKPAQTVRSGQVIGQVEPLPARGQGRVNWGVLVNGNLVDPLQFSSP